MEEPGVAAGHGEGEGVVAPQREWFEKDYYDVLGVSATASAKDITRAYRKLARELHPDANPGDTAAEEKFKEVSAAYDVIGDEAKRAEYDEVRRMGPMGGMGFGGPGAGGFGGPGGAGFNFEGADLGDLLGGLFGGGGRRGRSNRTRGPQRGADLEATTRLSFRDAVAGLETTLNVDSDVACSTCHGSGATPGTGPTTCSRCGGRGALDDNQGMFSFSSPCPACNGAGQVITDPCASCRGTGVERRNRQVKTRIPAGVADGQRIRLKGRGGAGRNGGPAGDLYVVVQVAPDAVFGRDGTNLTVNVPITFAEAALGTKLTVPTLDGKPVTLKIPAGTPSGKVFRVKGRGIATKKSTGDLRVTVQVAVPESLTAEQRDALETLASTLPAAPREFLGV